MRHAAFTLIELLVVITIIVVLLALLTPALDKAIYNATLTVCAANQHGVATGVTAYASAFRRYYPHRPTADVGSEPYHIVSPPNDDRPTLRDFVAINKCLRCPFTAPVDLERTDNDSHVYTSFSLWCGFGLNGHHALNKLGDTMDWTDEDNDPPTSVNHTYRVLVSDQDDSDVAGLSEYAHPDRDGILVQYVIQDQSPSQIAGQNTGGTKWVRSMWRGGLRSPGDENCAFTDESVQRYTNVAWNEYQQDTPQMGRVPIYHDPAASGWPTRFFHQVPFR